MIDKAFIMIDYLVITEGFIMIGLSGDNQGIYYAIDCLVIAKGFIMIWLSGDKQGIYDLIIWW